ncbi:avidin/streptavidin family protein, partial [Azospirillum sp. A39]|uniref:avidin/streptavidin family protein n=1 Tax=Azospirillum sp. A39 TaxID=3462279 RepID=UPI004045F384
MSTAITRWINEYGSVMELLQDGDGGIVGLYRSSTGSTGTYLVVGWAVGPAPSAQQGQPVALAIDWRSLDGGGGDPSWHWVSGLGGQRLAGTGGQPDTMPLNHALVATTDFPGLAGPGTYIDKLLYRAQPAPTGVPLPDLAGDGVSGAGDPVDGLWSCRERPGLGLDIRVTDARYGLVEGRLTGTGGDRPVRGLTDTRATADGLAKQGLTLTAPLGASGPALSLAGSLRLADGVVTVTEMTSQGTSPGNAYLQT